MNTSQLSVIGLKTYKLLFRDKICGSKFWEILRGFIFVYAETVTISSRFIFAFAIICITYI